MTTESLQFELDFSPKPNNYPKIEQEKDPKPMKGDNKAEPKDIRQEKDEKIEKISQVLI
ncbi:MAG: hypothetical protein LBF15_06110 [Candidatus Peribacteria bacterium]|jgi:hypothetical protein|nr:hypothetical protein [Candidatus Peribacteria bacterium]